MRCRSAISIRPSDRRRDEQGAALVVTLAATVLVSAVCAALVIATSTESLIAGNFQAGMEAQYAAEAAASRVLAELAGAPDWNLVLSGGAPAVFADGPPSGTRTLADHSSVNLSQVVNLANCAKLTTCSSADIRRVTAERAWGLDNPVWRLHAYGPLALASDGLLTAPLYVTVLVADDQPRLTAIRLRTVASRTGIRGPAWSCYGRRRLASTGCGVPFGRRLRARHRMPRAVSSRALWPGTGCLRALREMEFEQSEDLGLGAWGLGGVGAWGL